MMSETLPGYSWYAAHEYGCVTCLQHAYPDTVSTCKHKLCVQQQMEQVKAQLIGLHSKRQQMQAVKSL